MDHSQHERLAPQELTVRVLTDAPVYDGEDHKIGSISHVHGIGAQAQAVIDVGGFLGIGSKPVTLALTELDIMRDGDGKVHAITKWTKDALEELPEHHH